MPVDHLQPNLELPNIATAQERYDFAAGLRRLADWLERTDAPIHRQRLYFDITAISSGDFEDTDRRAFESQPKRLIRQIGGRVHKRDSGESMRFVRCFDDHDIDAWDWTGHVRVSWHITREAVCVAKPTGETREVKKYGTYTDAERAKQLRDELDRLVVVETVPVVEYDCKPILGDAVQS
jgi:hypothetical protein